MQTLAQASFALLSDFFNGNGSSLQGDQRTVIQAFLETLEHGLKGTLPPKYHLLSLDPGMGKTQACAAFIRAWRNAGFVPASSILVGVSTLDELKAFVAGSGLAPDEFGVLTSDPAANDLGVDVMAHDSAPVLFTTQQMLRSRTKGSTFSRATNFHFHGQPRALRLWDEEILPSDGVVFRLDDLRAFASHLRSRFPEFVVNVDAFASIVDASEPGAILTIPSSLGLDANMARSAASYISNDKTRATFWSLLLMSGKNMVVASGSNGKELIGTTPSLPADFAPVVVMDASGRVRTTYNLWETHKNDLVRLPSASNDYENLVVRVWKRSVGKDKMVRNANVRNDVVMAIIDAVASAPSEDWLVISYKDSLPLLRQSVSAGLDPVTFDRVAWLNWGKHLGTNEFRHISNVIIVGQRTYPAQAYKALSLAASGLPLSASGTLDDNAIRKGEYSHHLLQALCRASVRKSSNGQAGPCQAFLVTSLGDIDEVLHGIFPGVAVARWKEDALPTGRVAHAIAHLEGLFSDPAVTAIAKKDLRATLGIKDASNLKSLVLDKPAFQCFLADQGLENVGQKLRRVVSAFPPIENGYVHDALIG